LWPAIGILFGFCAIKNINHPEYILFGIFCGECDGHCATMHQYNIIGNTTTLFVDTTDSYFKNYGVVICKDQITDQKKIDLANSILAQMPNYLFSSLKLTETFGCPDCTDGCGIYFEFKQDEIVKKFYIDYNSSELSSEMKEFAEFLKATITKLETK